jgi:hypothetical protein
MASQAWLPPHSSRLRNVACAIGLAVGGLVALLLCAGPGTPALSASGGSSADPARGTRVWPETDVVSGTWTSMQPITTVVGPDPFVWPITQHGVTVTFYRNSVSDSAWFTFTPQSSSGLPGGYLPTPYFFDLEGVYQINGERVSLGWEGIQLELTYDPSRLGEIEAGTLQFFHFGTRDWVRQGGDVDLASKTVTLRTKRTESFAVGGEPPRRYLYLSFVIRQ